MSSLEKGDIKQPEEQNFNTPITNGYFSNQLNYSEWKDPVRKSNDIFHIIVESANSIILRWDANGIFKYVNEYASQFFGYSRDEMIGKSSKIIVPDVELSGRDLTHLVQDIVENPQKYARFENENVRKNGEHVWISWTNKAILNENGNVVEIIAVGNDITERKRAEDALKKQNIELTTAKEKAEESDKLKSAFLSNLRHEIRTPMNGILGFTDLLKTPDLSIESQKKYIDAINSSGKRMLDVINALIDISQIETEKLESNPEPTNISELLDDLYECFEPETEKKGIKLKCCKNLSDKNVIVQADKYKLNQVISNLLKNAIANTKKGYIEFGCKQKKKKLFMFYVKDTGSGIKKEFQNQIFEHFCQGENPRIQEGTGLGLAISKAYVDLLGGTIKVRSEPSKGSIFFFTVSFEKSCVEEVVTKKKLETLQSPSIPHVLVAEDDQIIYFFLKEVFRLNNINSFYARDGLEAVETILNNPEINLVLLDIKMAGMDGLEAARRIKLIRPDVPVIAQSAFFSDEERHKAFQAGCDDFIAKPIDKNLLLKKIYSYTSK